MKALFLRKKRLLPAFSLLSLLVLQNPILIYAQSGFAEMKAVNQIDFVSPFEMQNSEFGEAVVRYYIPPGDDPLYFNMVQGSISNPFDVVWSVQNLALAPFHDTMDIAVWFNLDPREVYADGDNIPFIQAGVSVSTVPLSFAPSGTMINIIDYQVGNKTHSTGHYTVPAGSHFPGIPSKRIQFDWPPTSSTIIKTRGCDVPNIDLDSLHHGPGTDYSGDWNACVQAATTNSFGWLRTKHHTIDSLLDAPFGNDAESPRKMIKEFDMFMEGNGEGVFLEQMVQGKLAFIDKYKLPIWVKFQSVSDDELEDIDSPNDLYGHAAEEQTHIIGTGGERISRAWIAQEICDDEDVEMNYNCCKFYYDANGNGGHVENMCHAHSVNIVGVAKVGDNYGITWKDDERQDTIGGLRAFSAQLRPDTFEGVIYLLVDELCDTIFSNAAFGTLVQRCFVREVVSESYDPDITFEVSSQVSPSFPDWKLRVFPNPVYSGAMISIISPQGNADMVDARLLDLRGREISHQQLRLESQVRAGFRVPLEAPSGLYLLELRSSIGQNVFPVLVLE